MDEDVMPDLNVTALPSIVHRPRDEVQTYDVVSRSG